MLSIVRGRVVAAAVLAMGLTAGAAMADTVNYTGYTITTPANPSQGYGASNYGNVTIDTPVSGTYPAGRITLTGVSIAPDGVNFVGAANINAWCIDLNHTLAAPRNYTLGSLSDTTLATQLNALLNGAAVSNLDLSNSVNNAGLQVAIWRAVYPSSLYGASFTTSSTTINNKATEFLNNVANPSNAQWKASSTMQIVTLDPSPSGSTQRLITLLPGSNNNQTSVPEPASMMLISVGLAGIALARRRRRSVH